MKPQVCYMGEVKSSRSSCPCKCFVELLSVFTSQESTGSNEGAKTEPDLYFLKAVPPGLFIFIYYI